MTKLFKLSTSHFLIIDYSKVAEGYIEATELKVNKTDLVKCESLSKEEMEDLLNKLNGKK